MTIVSEFKLVLRGNGGGYAASVYLPGDIHPVSAVAGQRDPVVAATAAMADAVRKTGCKS